MGGLGTGRGLRFRESWEGCLLNTSDEKLGDGGREGIEGNGR